MANEIKITIFISLIILIFPNNTDTIIINQIRTKAKKNPLDFSSILETYSNECKISLSIKSCYKSCKNCTLYSGESNEANHNCIECNEEKGYYHFLDSKSSNCYNGEEISNLSGNYYLDIENKVFRKRNPSNKRRNRPTDEGHPFCEVDKYFYDGKCLSICPDGTFESENNLNQKVCEKCYKNCEKCSKRGNQTNMMCTSCPENSIFYRYNNNDNELNCYEIYDNQIKSFYEPENSGKISSCLSLVNKYIIENTNECIDIPNEGYFISNTTTGLLSPCNKSCHTCSKGFTETNQNCDSCKNSLYLQDGNCVENCDKGYYLNDKICHKCHNNCETCTEGSIFDSFGNLTSMKCSTCINFYSSFINNNSQEANNEHIMIKNEENCFPIIIYNDYKIIFNISEIDKEKEIGTCLDFNKSIFYGEYECIQKPNNTFYVLNNNETYGVIENCSEACESCLGENMTNDTSCIECTSNYYKTEDSNSNCILESLIPHNYYKNETDNIYYKCHQNCYNCTSKPDSFSMNCILCAENYYKFPDGSYPNNCLDNSTFNSWKANIIQNTNLIESSFNILEESSFFQETTYTSETDSIELESTLIIIEENERSS